MSFWNLSDGSDAARDVGNSFEIEGGGDMSPIPKGSRVLALIDEAVWTTRDNAEFVSLRWTITVPEQYKNRKIFHKLYVADFDPRAKDDAAAQKKRDKAKQMFLVIDANAGGHIRKSGEMPSDEAMAMHLTNKIMAITLQEWDLPDEQNPGERIRGNWVSRVEPKAAGYEIAHSTRPTQAPAVRRDASPSASPMYLDDDIPF